MVKTTFCVDLGQGDGLDIVIESDEEYALKQILKDIKKSKDWVIFGTTAIQVSKIKRIYKR